MMEENLPKIPNIRVLAIFLGITEDKLKFILENIDSFYYENKVFKLKNGTPVLDKNGVPKIRIIHPSTGILKLVQEKIRRNILLRIALPKNIKGGVKGESNIKNAKLHVGNKYKFATDLKDFFPSISENNVYQMFRSHGYFPKVASALAKLVTYKGCLPQGTSTSTDIANLVFLPIDVALIEFCQSQKIKYTRFVDDLSFSAGFDFREQSLNIIRLINRDFKINNKKTFYTSGKAQFTGLWVGVSSLDVDDEIKRKIEEEDRLIHGDATTPRRRYRRSVRNAKKSN